MMKYLGTVFNKEESCGVLNCPKGDLILVKRYH